LITLAITTLNSSSTIRRTLESVEAAIKLSQTSCVVLADGGSSDNTIDIVSKFPFVKIISKSDAGLVDAWNKCVDAATTEYISFLGDSDTISMDYFSILEQQIIKHNSIPDIINFKIKIIENGHVTKIVGARFIRYFFEERMYTYHTGLLHLVRFVKKNGYFKEGYGPCLDYEFLLRTRLEAQWFFVNETLASMESGGWSSDQSVVAPIIKRIRAEQNINISPIRMKVSQFLVWVYKLCRQ